MPWLPAAAQQLPPCRPLAPATSPPACPAAIGCGQWQLAEGSTAWTCYVAQPALCSLGAALSVDPQQRGAASRACSPPEPGSLASSSGQPLPTVAALLATAPQLSTFRGALAAANLSGLPGGQLTGGRAGGGGGGGPGEAGRHCAPRPGSTEGHAPTLFPPLPSY